LLGGLGALGCLRWNSLTSLDACFIPEAGIHEFLEFGYPTHLIRYWMPLWLGVGHALSTVSTS
jgi:hypothetical protein